MLLVGIDATAFTYRKCLTSEVFVIAMISQESTESKVWSDVVTTFEAHTPSAGFISEMVAQGEVELPIDIGITVIGQLCLCRHGETGWGSVPPARPVFFGGAAARGYNAGFS